MIQVGDTLPDGVLYHIDHSTRILQIFSILKLFAHKRVILIGVTGAFTPTCSMEHLPGFISKAALLHAKGVSEIYCMTVNDAFVVQNWSKMFPNHERVLFLADGSATFTKAIGMDLDMTRLGMGVRGQRFVLFVDNLVVRRLFVEQEDDSGASIYVDDVLKTFI